MSKKTKRKNAVENTKQTVQIKTHNAEQEKVV